MKKRFGFKNFGLKCKKKRVAVLFGGRGAEHNISVSGAEFVLRHIDRESFDVIPIFIDTVGEWFADFGKHRCAVTPARISGEGGILRGRRFLRLDAVFPMLHGDFGEDGRVQGLLETLGIPFVGCDTSAGALAADKSFTKSVAVGIGIPTLPWVSCFGGSAEDFCRECESTLGYPVFIKPARLGSSIGAGSAADRKELLTAFGIARKLGGGRVIAERCLEDPRELECAYLSLGGTVYIAKPGEINVRGGFYDYEKKYESTGAVRISESADIDRETSEKLREYTARLCAALGVLGPSRVDFFLSGAEIYFNEINTMPGMTESSLYPKMIRTLGITEEELINGLLWDTVGGAP